MKAFEIKNKDDAYLAVSHAISLADAVQTLLAEGSDLEALIEKADRLSLYKEAAATKKKADTLKDWLAHVKNRQDNPVVEEGD